MSSTVLRPVASDAERAIPLFWLAVFAALSIAFLLFAFQQVVHSAVQKAQSQRIAEVERADNAWRCRSLPRRAERNACPATVSVQARGSSAAPAHRGPSLTATAALARP